MKRYTISKEAADLLSIRTYDAMQMLGAPIKITNEALAFKHISLVSTVLTEEAANFIRKCNLYIKEETTKHNVILAGNYETLRSFHFKVKKKGLTGRNVKVAVMDSGCVNSVVPSEFQVNFADANPGANDVLGHGTQTASIIKHPTIGLAPDCELHIVKSISDVGSMNDTMALAGLDYILDNDIDIANFSWQYFAAIIRQPIADIVANNTIICAASGNNTSGDFTALPASLPGVVAVNAINEAGGIHYRNVTPFPIEGVTTHGVSVACAGVGSQTYTKNNTVSNAFGTSFSSPFFTGLLACYKEELGVSDNQLVLQHALTRARKTSQSLYFGAGVASF